MRSRKWMLVLTGVIVLSLVGCNGARELRKKLAAREAKLEECLAERETLKRELESKESQLEQTKDQLEEARAKQTELSELRNKLEEAAQARKKRVEELRSLVENLSGMSGESRDVEDFIVIENKVLFPSGKITLTEDAQKTLENSVVQYLKDHIRKYPNQQVRIDGHTDGEPISVSGWEDNYHLAAMRAHSVMSYLASKGVAKENMYIVGFGPNRPRVEPPKPTAAVPENRRVEILMVPEQEQSPRQMLEELAE